MTDQLTGPTAGPSTGKSTGKSTGSGTAYGLNDRYERDDGRVFVSGVQALARIPLEQLRVDRRAGLRTAAFVSGYPGSPLAGFDKEAAAAAKASGGLPYIARPGLNEELAATAVMGSQLAGEVGGARYDGVIGIWYGKAPGLDRANDAIRHGVFAGTGRHGGVVALVGDDPAAKSSTLPSSSDATLVDLHIPILYPGDVQEALDLGRHAIALSRAAGLWTSLKVVAGMADGTGTLDLDPMRVQPSMPVVEIDGKPFVPHPSGRLITPYTLELEKEFQEVRLEVARRYGIDNGLNRITADPSDAWIGIISSGYTYHEVLEALRLLGLDDLRAVESAGIRLLQLRMPVPLDVSIVHEFAHGLSEIFVIEEKNPTLEWLVKDALYGWSERPLVVGKRDESGARLIPATGHTDADAIIGPLRRRLAARLDGRLAPLPRTARQLIPLAVTRTPYFCSGCPHNWGTKVPEGSLYGAGIGCHAMTTFMDEDRVGQLAGVGAMGNEGAQWVGMAPFVDTPHMIQNLGDGTYFHSGQLAVQFAVAAGVNITYKLLFNGTVAMTGGQDAQGTLPVASVARILLLQGVKRVLITTDDTDRYDDIELPAGVDVWERERIVEAQMLLATVPGVTVLIHDQECAAEKRRDRKRGKAVTPKVRVLINERICEGCGDCGDKSNCLSVQPVDTPFGRKTRIDQTSCNLDFSCIQGDCPSFSTVEMRTSAGTPKQVPDPDAGFDPLPLPTMLMDPDDCTIRMPGIGGTGVVTVSQILGTAAMLSGRHVRGLDQTGLSQKAGIVVSDLRISGGGPVPSNKATSGRVDVLLAFDLLAAANAAQLDGASPDRTVAVGSTSVTPTGAMVVHPQTAYPVEAELRARIDGSTRPEHNVWVDAGAVTTALFGDATTANVLLLGAAYQAGCIPVDHADIERAIELNGVAVARNLAAFRWGRRCISTPSSVSEVLSRSSKQSGLSHRGTSTKAAPTLPDGLVRRIAELDAITGLGDEIRRFADDLLAYQSAPYAKRYLDRLQQVVGAEQRLTGDGWPLTTAVARNLHRLMAYKDEYEVARLLLLPEATEAAEELGGPGAAVRWHLHPPMLRAMGMRRKLQLGRSARPVMALLARGRRLRGTPLDPFGRAEVRKVERALIAEYDEALDVLLDGLTDANRDEAVAIAGLPDQVRGYEHLKLRRAAEHRVEMAGRLHTFRSTSAGRGE